MTKGNSNKIAPVKNQRRLAFMVVSFSLLKQGLETENGGHPLHSRTTEGRWRQRVGKCYRSANYVQSDSEPERTGTAVQSGFQGLQMAEMLLVVVWNCQVKYFCLQKSVPSVLMVLCLHSWKIRAHREFHLEGCQKPAARDGNMSGQIVPKGAPSMKLYYLWAIGLDKS